MYDRRDRQALAEVLAGPLLDGRWTRAGLVTRAAATLSPRPLWLEELAAALLIRFPGPARPEIELRPVVVAEIRRFLAARIAREGEDESPPWITRTAPAGLDHPRTAPAGLDHPRTAPAGLDHPDADLPSRPPSQANRIDRGWSIAVLPTTTALADALELSHGQLEWLADLRGLERTVGAERLRNYRYRWVPRAAGLPRMIEAPKLRLKEIQRWILRRILDAVPPHDAAHGFTPGRSVRSHAMLHTGRAAVLRLDLRDFFATVSAGRVYGIFATLGYPPPVARVLTGLTTNVTARRAWDALGPPATAELVGARHRLGRQLAFPHLPQGAPTSPALANLAAHGLDRRLRGLAAVHELRYSRYADDLTFSGDCLVSGRHTTQLTARVAAIAAAEGFAINPRKSMLRTAARRQTVTGIVVNAHPNVARDEYDRLRATLHRLTLDGPPAPDAGTVDLEARLRGRVAWVASLNPARGAKLARQLDTVAWRR